MDSVKETSVCLSTKVDEDVEINEDESEPLQCATKSNNQTKNVTLLERLKIIKENTTVEPIMACYTLPSILSTLAVQNLYLEKACRVNYNFSAEVCDALERREIENYTSFEKDVQTYVAGVQSWKNVIQTTIPVILILFVGAWSDKTGRRKACILMPIVGEFVMCVGFIINTYFFELPVEVTAINEAVFISIFGGWVVSHMGMYSYIGDITTEEDRTYRVGIVHLSWLFGYPIATAFSGVLLQWTGFYGMFCITGSLYLFCIVYGYFCLEDTNRKIGCGHSGCLNFFQEFFDLTLVLDTIKVAFKRGATNTKHMMAYVALGFFICGPYVGETTVLYMSARYRFNWDAVQYSIWSTFWIFSHIFGLTVAVSLFSKRLKLDDSVLGIIIGCSQVAAAFAYAFARNAFEMYLVPIIDTLNRSAPIPIRSISMKIVSEQDYGKVNSLFGLVEAVVPMLFAPLYLQVYSATLEVLPGAVFLVGALFMSLSVLIYWWLYFDLKNNKIGKEVEDT